MQRRNLFPALAALAAGLTATAGTAQAQRGWREIPEPRFEPTPAERRGYGWRPGHWDRGRRDYVWVRGRHFRGREGAQWAAPRWDDRDGRRVWVPGSWR